MTRRTERDGPAMDGATPHEMVRELERSIAARLSAAESAGDEVAQAEARANAILAAAEAQATETGRAHAAAILSSARVEAERLVDEGMRAADDLTATAARCRADDVATVLARVLPQGGV